MSTNYYAIQNPTEELKTKIKNAVDADDFELVKELIPKKIHIGLSAAGWKFLFNHNEWEFFEKTLDSLQNFLKQCQIVNEYGNEKTFEEFWNLVESKQNEKEQLVWRGTVCGTIEFGYNFSTSTNFC